MGKILSSRVTLKRKGFTDIIIRNTSFGWQVLEHVYAKGDERWEFIKLSLDQIKENIHKYASKREIKKLIAEGNL